MRNKLYRMVSCALTCMLVMSIFTGCSRSRNRGVNDAPVSPGDLAQSGQSVIEKEDKQVTALPLDTVMMTVNDQAYTLGDIMYVIYYLEQDYSYKAIGFEETYGIDFWNDIYDESTNETGADLARKSMMETAQMVAILSPIAEKEGYKCSGNELKIINEEAESIVSGLSKEYLERTGFTNQNIADMLKKLTIVNKYVLDQVDQQKVDEAKIKSEVDPNSEDYKQVMLEYICLGTKVTDEFGDTKYLGAEEITGLLKKGKSMLKEIQSGKSMEAVYNKQCTPSESNIFYTEEAVLNAELEESMVRAIGECKEGQLYDDMVETEDGYLIFRLVSNNATDAYDNYVADEINTAKNEAYDKAYQKLVSTYKVTQNKEAWEKLVLGHYAYSEPVESVDDSDMAKDDEYFDLSGLTGGSEIELPDDAANGDDGSVG